MNRAKQGFTLIELMLAMAFIASLLLAIALTVIQLSETYNHGLTLRDMQQTSRTINSDLSYDVSNAAAFSLAANGGHYVTQSWGGALCLGQYSYVWNFGQAITNYNAQQDPNINLLQQSNGSKTAFNLVKVNDAGGTLCSNTSPKTISATSAVELIQNTDHNLALHEFCVTTSPTASYALTGQQLYTISYAIGTNDAAALTTNSSPACGNVTNTSDQLLMCKPPNAVGADFEYCADQEFSLVARAQNASNN